MSMEKRGDGDGRGRLIANAKGAKDRDRMGKSAIVKLGGGMAKLNSICAIEMKCRGNVREMKKQKTKIANKINLPMLERKGN